MCKTQLERLAVASQISLAIGGKISEGAVNLAVEAGKGEKYDSMDEALELVRKDANQAAAVMKEKDIKGMLAQLAYFRIVKNSAKAHGVANCGELAGYVFLKLYKKGVFPIHMVGANNVRRYANHAFITIGLPAETRGECRMSEWPEDVVICDPWLMQRLAIYKMSKAEHRGAYTPAEYIESTKAVFGDGDRVNVMFGSGESLGAVPKVNLK